MQAAALHSHSTSKDDIDTIITDSTNNQNIMEATATTTDAPLSFISLPDDAFFKIASFASPCDVYNVALTSKRFHQPCARQQQQQQQKKDHHHQEAAAAAVVAHPPRLPTVVVLATRMLRSSLLSNLSHVLKTQALEGINPTRGYGFTLEDVMDLASINYDDDSTNEEKSSSPHVLLVGRTIVQACLGKQENLTLRNRQSHFSTPMLDLCCSAKAAPKVRSWIVEKARTPFCGFTDLDVDLKNNELGEYPDYNHFRGADSQCMHTIDHPKIHHVESYACPGNFRADQIQSLRPENQEEFDDAVKEQSDHMLWIDFTDPDFHVKPAEGGELLFQSALPLCPDGDNVHLIVANKMHSEEEEDVPSPPTKKAKYDCETSTATTTSSRTARIEYAMGRTASSHAEHDLASEYVMPLEVLEDFTLNICKASFDGRTFRIPDPHLTFQGKTKMESSRKALVECYLRDLPKSKILEQPLFWTDDNWDEITMGLRNAIPNDAVIGAVAHWHGDPPLELDDDYKLECFVRIHNWVARMFHCNQFYRLNGIVVVDAPFCMTLPHQFINYIYY